MKRIEEIRIQCIDDIRAGRAILQDCLDRYPGIRHDLEPFLKIALSIKEPANTHPSDAFKVRARANLMDNIRVSQSKKPVITSSSQPSIRYGWFTGWARAIAITVMVVIVMASAGTGTAYASQSSLPGDTLYPVKLGTEQIQRIITFDSADEVDLELKFASIRLDELEELASMPANQVTGIQSTGKILTASVIGFIPSSSEKSYITQAERIKKAACGYEENLNLAITKSEQLKDGKLLETVSLAILNHLDRLDQIEDKALGGMAEAIAHSQIIALNGHMNAIQNLAAVNHARANEINLLAIQSRIKRAEDEAARGNSKGAQNTLENLEKLQRFGDMIQNQDDGEGQALGYNNNPIPSKPQETTVPNPGQSQIPGGGTNQSNGGQELQNQPQQDEQGKTSTPGTTPNESSSTQQPGDTPGGTGDGTQQPSNSSSGTSTPSPPGENPSGSGSK